MGKQWKEWLTLFLGGSKITADGDCSHEIKRCLLLGMKVITNLDSILKSRDITLPTKVHLVKAMVFPMVMYGCESWTIKKAEHRRIDAFVLWCWRKLLRVPWTARRSNQSISAGGLFTIWPIGEAHLLSHPSKMMDQGFEFTSVLSQDLLLLNHCVRVQNQLRKPLRLHFVSYSDQMGGI